VRFKSEEKKRGWSLEGQGRREGGREEGREEGREGGTSHVPATPADRCEQAPQRPSGPKQVHLLPPFLPPSLLLPPLFFGRGSRQRQRPRSAF